jgi:L-rhamnose mutarotase
MFMETVDDFDPDRDFPRYEASNPRNREWQELMASMQEPVPGARPGEWWAEMELLFSL